MRISYKVGFFITEKRFSIENFTEIYRKLGANSSQMRVGRVRRGGQMGSDGGSEGGPKGSKICQTHPFSVFP